jgi:phosphotransferase system HPr (HPr) family protein
LLVKTASKYESDITIEQNNIKVSCKSIMGLLTIAISCGTKIKIVADGTDSECAINDLHKSLEDKFYEE